MLLFGVCFVLYPSRFLAGNYVNNIYVVVSCVLFWAKFNNNS